MRPPKPAAVLLVPALVSVLALGGCGRESPEEVTEAAASSDVPSVGSLQVREVTTTNVAAGAAAPTTDQQAQLDAFDCGADAPTLPAEEPMVACDDDGTTYLLEPAGIDGGVESAEASEADGSWVVQIVLGPDSSQRLAELSGELVGTPDQLALVIDGEVIAAPTVSSRITDGALQVSGDLTEEEATDLAERIQAGA